MEIKHNFPNIWDTAKAVIRDNCIAIQANYKKEKTQINNVTQGMTQDEMVGWHHQLNGHEIQ